MHDVVEVQETAERVPWGTQGTAEACIDQAAAVVADAALPPALRTAPATTRPAAIAR